MPAIYRIRLPHAALRPFIECYWFLKMTVEPPGYLDELIFTDGRADIVFTYDSPYVRIKGGESADGALIRASNVDAQRRYPVRIRQRGRLHLIGVRFRPGGLSAFVRIPVHELSGYTVGLSDGLGPEGAALEEKLFWAAGRIQAQVDLLDHFFLSRMAVLPEYRRVMSWVQEMEHHRGLISVRDLSRAAGLSMRSVDRLFKRVIGLPPKFFARTVRFRHVHKHLLKCPAARWDEIVVSYGYFDQSHFIKDVTSLTGVDPTAYRAYLARPREGPPPNHVQFLQDNEEGGEL